MSDYGAMASPVQTPVPASEPKETPLQYWRVRSSFPIDQKRTLLRSISEKRARRWLMNRVPRGEEAYLEAPDGTTTTYVQEREGPHGEDLDQWQPFDPETWKPPSEQEPPGQSAWGDVEG